MPSFSYRAVNGGGQQISGVLTAENYQVALRMLEEQALYPIKVSEGAGAAGGVFSGRRRVKSAQLTTFYGQLADLLKAGVPMLRSLDVLSKQASSGAMSLVIKELREDVAGGTALGESMAKQPHAFTPLHSSMFRRLPSGR